MIELHYAATPNGQKIAIMLEETGLPYRVKTYDIFEGDHLDPAFGAVNPNHKLPAIVDLAPGDGDEPLSVFESGAVLQYLAEKSGQLLDAKGRGRSRALQWLTWQVAGLGPMGGQASHFLRYAPDGQNYAIARYTRELDRLLHVLENRLAEAPYLAGDAYSIADIAVWPGRAASHVMGIGFDGFPAIADWFDRVAARPAVERAMNDPVFRAPDKYMGRNQRLSEDQWSNMFGDRMHDAVHRESP